MAFLYEFAQKMGYDHPLHPAVTHMSTGLIVGAFLFLTIALIFKRSNFLTTARHCMVLALTFLFPTAFLGYTDWLHYYDGVWSFPIKMKLVLTGVLLIFLIAAVIIKNKGGLVVRIVIYFLCLLAVAGVGYYGGDIVFPQDSAASSGDIGKGEKLYAANCGGCHPNGGNVINSQFPVVGSQRLKDLNTFVGFNRNPLRPDGSKGVMPAFSKEKISDQDMGHIYACVTKGLKEK